MTSEKVMVNYNPKRKTRLYVDEGPEGVAATVAQCYKVEGMDHEVWHPVSHNSRSKTNSERNYGMVSTTLIAETFLSEWPSTDPS